MRGVIQSDASPRDWLEGRGPRLTLLAAIDDATGAPVAAVFWPREDAHDYMLLVRRLVTTHGCPLTVYHDRHGIFQVNIPGRETLEEQLAGQRDPTPPPCGRASAPRTLARVLIRTRRTFSLDTEG